MRFDGSSSRLYYSALPPNFYIVSLFNLSFCWSLHPSFYHSYFSLSFCLFHLFVLLSILSICPSVLSTRKQWCAQCVFSVYKQLTSEASVWSSLLFFAQMLLCFTFAQHPNRWSCVPKVVQRQFFSSATLKLIYFTCILIKDLVVNHFLVQSVTHIIYDFVHTKWNLIGICCAHSHMPEPVHAFHSHLGGIHEWAYSS